MLRKSSSMIIWRIPHRRSSISVSSPAWPRRIPIKPGDAEAENDLEVLIQKETATPEDNHKLMQMYLNNGNWLKARELLRRLVTKDDKDPRFLIMYIQELLKRRRAFRRRNVSTIDSRNRHPLGSSPSA